MGRPAFALRVMGAYLRRADKDCPYCGNPRTDLIGFRRLIVQLRKCSACKLMFRWPKDSISFNRRFYQSTYRQEGLTTDLPDLGTIKQLRDSKFVGSEKDYRDKIAILKALLPRGRVLDFGSSWGYTIVQLEAAGLETIGFEISKPRADFGREHLGVTILSDYESLDGLGLGAFDAIFSSHVLEHLPNLNGVFDRLRLLLRPGGLLLVFVPNCGGDNAKRLGAKWGPMIFEKHAMAFDCAFFEHALPKHGFSVTTFSEPYNPSLIARRVSEGGGGDTRGDELCVCAVKNQ
jgi:2-polyprenyl-3-methyl-5-hydroxy-6-metoxy-1,4-benzoquinol methylase